MPPVRFCSHCGTKLDSPGDASSCPSCQARFEGDGGKLGERLEHALQDLDAALERIVETFSGKEAIHEGASAGERFGRLLGSLLGHVASAATSGLFGWLGARRARHKQLQQVEELLDDFQTAFEAFYFELLEALHEERKSLGRLLELAMKRGRELFLRSRALDLVDLEQTWVDACERQFRVDLRAVEEFLEHWNIGRDVAFDLVDESLSELSLRNGSGWQHHCRYCYRLYDCDAQPPFEFHCSNCGQHYAIEWLPQGEG